MLSDDLKPYIAQVQRREITNRELAILFGTHESYVCRVLKRLGVKREAVARPLNSKQIRAERLEHRLRVAKTLPVREAARAAGCSERTIYRIRSAE